MKKLLILAAVLVLAAAPACAEITFRQFSVFMADTPDEIRNAAMLAYPPDSLQLSGSEFYAWRIGYTQAFMEIFEALLEYDGTEQNPEPTPDPVRTQAPVNVSFYVINTNTDKFHHEDCRAVKDIKPANRVDMNISRDLLIQLGFSPCKICKP